MLQYVAKRQRQVAGYRTWNEHSSIYIRGVDLDRCERGVHLYRLARSKHVCITQAPQHSYIPLSERQEWPDEQSPGLKSVVGRMSEPP